MVYIRSYDKIARNKAKVIVDILTPVVKAWGSDTGIEVANTGIQIHGGMGLMEELPLERIWRDARLERIWEGTSEIQRHIISRSLLRSVGG
mgnify:CR=1 FL=1